MSAEEKPLYPFGFLPAETGSRHWGRETYRLADLGEADTLVASGWLGGNTLSELMETYLERVVGEMSFAWYGTQFPVSVKRLDVEGRTSLRVNADDEAAAQRYDAFGKTALWYVADVRPGATLYLGFSRPVTAAEFYVRARAGTIEEVLHTVRPHPSDHFLIPPGLVHAAAGVTLVEIAEASDLYFRLYDWGREADPATARPMHLEEAFDLIDFGAWTPPEEHHHRDADRVTEQIARTPQFSVTEIRLTDALHIYAEEAESFFLYVCVRGEASVQVPAAEATERYPLRAGDVLLVPAETRDFFLVPQAPDTLLLETVMDHRPLPDPYVDGGAGEEGHPHHHHHDDEDEEEEEEDHE